VGDERWRRELHLLNILVSVDGGGVLVVTFALGDEEEEQQEEEQAEEAKDSTAHGNKALFIRLEIVIVVIGDDGDTVGVRVDSGAALLGTDDNVVGDVALQALLGDHDRSVVAHLSETEVHQIGFFRQTGRSTATFVFVVNIGAGFLNSVGGKVFRDESESVFDLGVGSTFGKVIPVGQNGIGGMLILSVASGMRTLIDSSARYCVGGGEKDKNDKEKEKDGSGLHFFFVAVCWLVEKEEMTGRV